MKKSRFSTEQIIGFIKQADAGMAVAERRSWLPRSVTGGRRLDGAAWRGLHHAVARAIGAGPAAHDLG